jgi:hypothetical protein
MLKTYRQMLDVIGLNPDIIHDIAKDDPEAVVPVIRAMTDQIVRGEIILEHTMIDAELDHLLYKHFFGTSEKMRKARKTAPYRTFRLILQNMYLLQKLSIIKTFKKIPKNITRNVAAINDLRNGLAHTFFVEEKKAKVDGCFY